MTARGIDLGLIGCTVCGKLVRCGDPGARVHCPRCSATLRPRKPHSIQRTWALLLAAMILYVPANLLPIMRTSQFGDEVADTILSGVVYFLFNGDWPLALIIFTASVLVPLLKMLALVYLLVSVQAGDRSGRRQRTSLYRVTELMGRWSMVDVFVIALLTALVQAGSLASVAPDVGAIAFCAVVILTMFAAMSFDPRLIWDRQVQ